MSRDDGWRFSRVGPQPRARRHDDPPALARATATPSVAPGWTTTLRTLLGVRGVPARLQARGRRRRRAVEFLLLDRLFPRSVYHALTTAEQCLGELDPRSARAGVDDEARRRLGRHVRRARVPAPRRGDGRPPARCSPSSSASAPTCTRRSPGATSARPASSSGASEHVAGACGSGTRPRTSTRRRCTRRTTRRGSRRSTRRTSSRSSTASRCSPAANLFRYRDYWGSRVHAFDLHHAHTELIVVGTSLVETAERTPNLDDIGRVGRRSTRPGMIDRFFEYLGRHRGDRARRRDPSRSPRELRDTCPTPGGARSSQLGEWLRGARRVPDGHDERVTTTAAEVLRAGRGVCQDYVHLGLAVLRAAGIPARYASGYLYPDARRRRGRDAPRARATRGSRPGSATGTRSTPPAARRSPSATCSWPAAATTPTSCR